MLPWRRELIHNRELISWKTYEIETLDASVTWMNCYDIYGYTWRTDCTVYLRSYYDQITGCLWVILKRLGSGYSVLACSNRCNTITRCATSAMHGVSRISFRALEDTDRYFLYSRQECATFPSLLHRTNKYFEKISYNRFDEWSK